MPITGRYRGKDKQSEEVVRVLTLIKAGREDLRGIYEMQVAVFTPLLQKYGDLETNPAAEPFERTLFRFMRANTDFYLISLDGKSIGAARVRAEERVCVLSQIFILGPYQGRGYAQQAIGMIESLYPKAKRWTLDTIAQEAKLCHLYEKMGYLSTGESRRVKAGMDIVYYEKAMEKSI